MVAFRVACGEGRMRQPHPDRASFVHVHRQRLRDQLGRLRASVRRHRARFVPARATGAESALERRRGPGRRRARVLDVGAPPRRPTGSARCLWPLRTSARDRFRGRLRAGRTWGQARRTRATPVFSFHATKPFAIGEGGAIITRQPRARRARRADDQLRDRHDDQHERDPGLNRKLSGLRLRDGPRDARGVAEQGHDAKRRRARCHCSLWRGCRGNCERRAYFRDRVNVS